MKNKLNKKGQEEKTKASSFILSYLNRKGQEEMIGFSLIVVLVSVIILIFLAIILYDSDDTSSIQSYQVESFVSAVLTYTTDCSESYQDHLPVQKVITSCLEKKKCDNGLYACDVLKEILNKTVRESWSTNNRPVNGFKFSVLSDSEPIIVQEGNLTGNSRTAIRELILSNKEINVSLEIYG
jgi:hypothetical protein